MPFTIIMEEIKMKQVVTLAHGDGGFHTQQLIQNVFLKHYANNTLTATQDAAILPPISERIAFTTDSFVVNPLFFRGGDIGKLAICGTVNDLVAMGASPRYISAGFIIEEGFPIKKLEQIAASMAEVCQQTGALIVTGDTKVVEKGLVNGVFINTSGIGSISPDFSPQQIKDGDEILITGSIAEHGTEVLLSRAELDIQGSFASDCAPLHTLLSALQEDMTFVKMMRDPTRGGVATALCELAQSANLGAYVFEQKLLVRKNVAAVHALLGTDPLYYACEGRMIMVVKRGHGERICKLLKQNEQFKDCEVIGAFDQSKTFVRLINEFGGQRILRMLENEMIARIC